MKKANSIIGIILVIALIFTGLSTKTAVAYGDENFNRKDIFAVDSLIEDVINWKKSNMGYEVTESLFQDEFLEMAGSTSGDWYAMALGRYGYEDNYGSYLGVIDDYIETEYKTDAKLDIYKATEWQRIGLAITAVGGNPKAFSNFEGSPIDLVSDGSYNRGLVQSPGRQGINGWIYGLIFMDSKRYEIPDTANDTREDFILELLKLQLADGGFALMGNKSDVDITAMTLQALAPYYNSEREFSYVSAKIKDEKGEFIPQVKTVREVVDESVLFLSSTQNETGTFASWGSENSESSSQVILALTALRIDPHNDQRFVKNDKSAIDGLLTFKQNDGGFTHSYSFDSENPNAVPSVSSSMASEQALCALISYDRFLSNQRTFYDMREDFTVEEIAQISAVEKSIERLNQNSTKLEIQQIVSTLEESNITDLSYVNNYWNLSAYAKKHHVKLLAEKEIYQGNQEELIENIVAFTDVNVKQVEALIDYENLTTENYVEVVHLMYLLENTNEFQKKNQYKTIVDKAYNHIQSIKSEIEYINMKITTELYPFSKLSLKDKAVCEEIFNRYENLSQVDKGEVTHIDDLIRAKTQLDNLTTAWIIGGGLSAISLVVIAIVVIRIRKRQKVKRSMEMEESQE